MYGISKWVLTVLFSMLTAGVVAQSGNQGGGYVGIVYGLSVPDIANTKTHQLYGVKGGSQISDSYGFGGYHMVSSEETGRNNGDFSFSLTGLEFRSFLTGGDKKVYVGVRAGVSKFNTVENSTDVIFSPYHYGIVSGYDFKLFSLLNVGIEGSFMAMQRSLTTAGSTEVELKPFHLMSFLGVINLAF
ncbi:MAG: hypothetical protein H6624_10740 [Bdellovibrionaceae bacterium]|nr:hypothetical protein [Bdellovibrionales bacterium]MCB9084813.1 hypothetical protein [Pseudobdellovibrionaceae bacterium]